MDKKLKKSAATSIGRANRRKSVKAATASRKKIRKAGPNKTPKNMNENKNRPITTLWYALALAALAVSSASAQNSWVGTGPSLNWSETGNWSSGVPDNNALIFFEDLLYNTGYTNGAGVINNMVDSPTTVGSARYTATATGGGLHFYTTMIPSGMTLTLQNAQGAGNAVLAVGDAPWNAPFNTGGPTNYTTI